MDILDALLSDYEWLSFLEYKKEKGHLNRADEEALSEFITEKNYLYAAEYINNGGLFSLPEAVKINKSNSTKKRTVYIFNETENYIQKFIAWKLLDYDYLFSDNLYSFRRDMGVKKALTRLIKTENIRNMYSYKLDISDYFNSVNAALILPELKEAISDNLRLYKLIEAMLLNDKSYYEGEIITKKKGIIAGSPLSGFLANLYLSKLDKSFDDIDVLYARYSDDIIVFAENENELNSYVNAITEFLSNKELSVNENKVYKSLPGEEWTFLGFSYKDGTVDISDVSKMKLKKKMRRKARALLRWKNKKNAEPERAVRAFIKYFKKRYGVIVDYMGIA
ncbi:MAG: hypothetical protein K6C14_01160, partial [Eubacterium sp.]|nr:hypothetical protein [Eubacterium sp.]